MADDKVEGKIDQASGNVKEGVGKVTGDDDLKNKGKAQQVEGDVKEGFGKVKDAIKDL
jgi:uncharacterized protein YjbJ (UPF0337 family)